MEKIQQMEILSVEENNKLIGGFSTVYSGADSTPSDTTKTNNCKGGNLVAGCGKDYKPQKLNKKQSNGNCVGNCVKGCGGY